MVPLRFLFACVLVLGMSGCRKKSDAAATEIGEAGYAMTAEGWFAAIRANDVPVMGKMADGGFDPKTPDADGDGGLHLAAASGGREAAEFLLDKGLSINAPGAGGRTPLMAAVIADKPAMVKWLLRQGADPKSRDRSGFMALMLAVSEGRRECVEELAPYHREDLDSALLLAALLGKADVIDALTNYGASVYARMEDGRTPLMLAAQKGHREAAELLIDIGASRFATLENGETAQSMAVAAGHAEIAEMIATGFSGDLLALESDEEVAEAMGGYPDGSEEQPGETAGGDGGTQPWNRPLPGQGGRDSAPAGEPSPAGRRSPVQPLEGASIGKLDAGAARQPAASETAQDLPLVMRGYRRRELPVEVKKVSGGTASLRIAGAPPKDIEVKAGGRIPGSDLSVVRVFTRTEQGKLNGGAPIPIGIVEVADARSGRKMEWAEGRPAAGHDPVALLEDAATGRRYLAKPGQGFTSEDGRGFTVGDVRPGQVVIEETAGGEVRTLRLRGPRG